MRVRVNKLWNCCVSVRDYLVDQAKDEGLTIEFAGRSMYLTPKQLLGGINDPNKYQSKWGNRSYQLIDFKFKPDNTQLSILP